jgi:hypothetical protein
VAGLLLALPLHSSLISADLSAQQLTAMCLLSESTDTLKTYTLVGFECSSHHLIYQYQRLHSRQPNFQ